MTQDLLVHGISLASVVLGLHCLQGGARARSLGHAAKALLLRAIASQDQALAAQVEASESDKAYTVSMLYNHSPHRIRLAAQYLSGKRYTLRLTALNSQIVQALNHAVMRGPLAPGENVDLDGIPFQVEAVTALPDGHPLAGQTDYGALALPWWSNSAQLDRKISLEIISPMTFKKPGDLYVPMPYPELIFGSLLSRWNAFAPVKLPEEWRRVFREEVVFSRYDLRSTVSSFKSGSKKIGALGCVTYQAPRSDAPLLQVLNLLADFALYSGAGLMTAMGLGQVHRI